MKIATILTNGYGQLGLGTAGFAAVVEPVQNGITDLVQQIPQGFENPGNYVKGLVVSGLIQIVLRLIDKWSANRKAKKEAEKPATK